MTTQNIKLTEMKNRASNHWIEQHKNIPSFRPKVQSTETSQSILAVANTIKHSEPRVNASSFAEGIQMMLVSPADTDRSAVEQFIVAGYAKHFDAKLAELFPVILAVKDINTDCLLGAVGLRYADDQKLFSEKYLSQPIESLISEHQGYPINRKHVIELGHFVVAQSSDVNTVIPVVAKFLKSLDVKWAVYTLSRPIKVAFQRMGIKLTHLQHAHPQALDKSKTDWGRYYDFKPAVYFSNILTNMN